MRRTNTRILMSVVVIGVLIAPVLLWSGGGISKQIDVVTIGTEYRPQQMTLAEKEEFSRRFMVESGIRFEPRRSESMADPVRPVEYPGMTRLELDKLARSRNAHPASASVPGGPVDSKDPVSTIESVPRAPGIEGMTPEERAKLEAYLKSCK
ncbi:MAG: hypothetical protein JSW50_10810 [Candidatus Latescibacterota bacterium]|nr:MAG: hypothetical protein JSW50_10810 [Candidatus Latescibacterota bacterium]